MTEQIEEPDILKRQREIVGWANQPTLLDHRPIQERISTNGAPLTLDNVILALSHSENPQAKSIHKAIFRPDLFAYRGVPAVTLDRKSETYANGLVEVRKGAENLGKYGFEWDPNDPNTPPVYLFYASTTDLEPRAGLNVVRGFPSIPWTNDAALLAIYHKRTQEGTPTLLPYLVGSHRVNRDAGITSLRDILHSVTVITT